MHFIDTALADVKIIEQNVFGEERSFPMLIKVRPIYRAMK